MAESTSPQPGATATASFQVTSSDLASAIAREPEDVFPNVFATSRLVALMEIASARIITPHLSTGQLSVGVSLDITHSAPTPAGSKVVAESTFKGKEGKLYVFDVVARDEGGEVGRAVHKRAVVDSTRLEATAEKRVKASTTCSI